MSLFPTRAPVKDFLAVYSALPEESEETAEDLADTALDDHEVEDFDHADLEDLIDKDTPVDDKDDAQHRAFDAATRIDEDAALEALAQRFERHAAATHDAAAYDEHEDELREIRAAQRKKACKEAAAADKAEKEAAAARAAEEAARLAKKQEALASLYAMYAENEEEEPPPLAGTAPTVARAVLTAKGVEKQAAAAPQEEREAAKVGGGGTSGGRYRIKKRKVA